MSNRRLSPNASHAFASRFSAYSLRMVVKRLQTNANVFARSSRDWHPMDSITSSSTRSGSYVTMTKEQVRRLVRQLPPHDSDARHCHGLLSDDDKRRLEEFRESRYRDALGQGTLCQLEKKTVCRQVYTISADGHSNLLLSIIM